MLEAQAATLAFVTSGIGLMMVWVGMKKNALEWKHRRRTCPSCGRIIAARTCGCV